MYFVLSLIITLTVYNNIIPYLIDNGAINSTFICHDVIKVYINNVCPLTFYVTAEKTATVQTSHLPLSPSQPVAGENTNDNDL